MNVQNIISKVGNPIANQFILKINGAEIYQSYKSIIAIRYNNMIILDEKRWNYSKTTGKYRNIFLNEDIKTTKRKIKNGVYKLQDLNNEDFYRSFAEKDTFQKLFG